MRSVTLLLLLLVSIPLISEAGEKKKKSCAFSIAAAIKQYKLSANAVERILEVSQETGAKPKEVVKYLSDLIEGARFQHGIELNEEELFDYLELGLAGQLTAEAVVDRMSTEGKAVAQTPAAEKKEKDEENEDDDEAESSRRRRRRQSGSSESSFGIGTDGSLGFNLGGGLIGGPGGIGFGIGF